MRWAGWFLVLGALACGGHADGGSADAGAGGTGGAPPPAVDGGVPDAGPSMDCDGVMPLPAGSAYTFDVATDMPTDTCDLATTDGQGIVAAKGGPALWTEFSEIGTHNGSFQTAEPEVLPQTSGFVGLSGSGTLAVEGWNASGGNFGFAVGGQAGMVALAPAQGDGAIVFSADSAGLKVRRLDPTLVDTESLTVAGTFTPRGGAQDASGAVLALVGAGSAVNAIWVDLTKGTAGAPFALGTATRVLARPLLAGGVAVRLDGRWSALLQPGDSTLHAPPAWLRDGTDIVRVRAGKAYALVPGTGASVDLVSPQGNLCGTMPFPGVNSVAIGPDGSVVGSSGPSGCTKVFWRNALR